MDFSFFVETFHHFFSVGLVADVMVYGWLSIAVLFLLLELSTTGLLFFFPFTIGAGLAGIAAMVGLLFFYQSVIFLMSSVLSFLLMRYYFVRVRPVGTPTNTDALVQQMAVVTKAIEPYKVGRVKVKGEEWLAAAKNNVVLHEGTHVQIVEIRGTKLIVK